jgi:hypothetical protein
MPVVSDAASGAAAVLFTIDLVSRSTAEETEIDIGWSDPDGRCAIAGRAAATRS